MMNSKPRQVVVYVWWTVPSARAKALITGASERYSRTSTPQAAAF